MDTTIPSMLQTGILMTKVSSTNKQKRVVFRLDADRGHILWMGKREKIIPIENIKELRAGADTKFYRDQFHLPPDLEDRWLTIVYMIDGRYKTLHLIAATKDIFQVWDANLRKLYQVRRQLMNGLGNVEMRETLWERQYWNGEGTENDQRLDFERAEKLAKRLSVPASPEELHRLFAKADADKRGYLDFGGFRRFVKLLKARPDIEKIYTGLCAAHGGPFDFALFEKFMRDSQNSTLSQMELQRIYDRYAGFSNSTLSSTASSSEGDNSSVPRANKQPASIPISQTPVPLTDPNSTALSHTNHPSPPLHSAMTASTSTDGSTGSETTVTNPIPSPTPKVMSLENLSAFLFSPDNSLSRDQTNKVSHDMTRPLSEYYISSSHNTYLVGNQVMGASTIEGYIRALLQSCRSVELDIYDGDTEPVIFHGKTFTSKVPLREVCLAINRYAFVTSPYPIIISAEVHCNLPQQDLMAKIMREVFGEILMSAPIEGRPKISALPSPEDLKGRILLKAKNLYTSENGGTDEDYILVEAEFSEPSSTDSDVLDIRSELDGALKDVRRDFTLAKNIMVRVRRRSPSPAPQGVPTPTRRFSLSKASDSTNSERKTAKMSFALAALLVYTIGVKCRGINKKETYAPEHVFSLSENTANKYLKHGMVDLIKHNRTHLVRIYPRGTRLNSTNYEPHRYWSAGMQLVAINWQTCDLGYMINHAMFERNGRAGYVLKPPALRLSEKEILSKRTKHIFDITIISAQQIPRQRDSEGREILGKSTPDPYVEITVHVPDWLYSPSPPSADTLPASASTPARTLSFKTSVVKNNGFNPVWFEGARLPFECVGDMMDLIFVKFTIRQESWEESEPLAVYCSSMGNLQRGYRHIPLRDARMSQLLFSTLFVKLDIYDV